jgi:ABC-2 type transport system permease protein
VLATPQTRRGVILGRFAALSTATIFIGLVALAATVVAARAAGLALDEGNVAAASLGMVPLGLLVGGIGYLGAGWLRTAADTGLLSFVLLFWFVVSFVGRDLGWPDATLRLSALYYYGNPLLKGLEAANVLGLLAVGAVTLAIGAWRFGRKDIAV